MADDQGIAQIDGQLAEIWATYRKWVRGEAITMSPLVAFETIDLLLEQRRDIASTQGELRDPRDVASLTEWGEGA